MNERQYNKLLSVTIENNEILKRIEARLDSEIAKERLTPKEVQTILRIGKTTYQRYLNNKVFKQEKIKGKAYVLRSEVEKLIEEGRM